MILSAIQSGHALRLDQLTERQIRLPNGQIRTVESIVFLMKMEYTPPGGQVIVSRRIVSVDDGWWSGICVSDTGPGIKKDERNSIFTRFFRGQVGQASGVSGTGLGLALAKEIVDRHHGQITLESEGIPGHGTTFHVLLPTASSSDSPEPSTAS